MALERSNHYRTYTLIEDENNSDESDNEKSDAQKQERQQDIKQQRAPPATGLFLIAKLRTIMAAHFNLDSFDVAEEVFDECNTPLHRRHANIAEQLTPPQVQAPVSSHPVVTRTTRSMEHTTEQRYLHFLYADVSCFALGHLRADGVLLLRMIANHAGPVVCTACHRMV